MRESNCKIFFCFVSQLESDDAHFMKCVGLALGEEQIPEGKLFEGHASELNYVATKKMSLPREGARILSRFSNFLFSSNRIISID